MKKRYILFFLVLTAFSAAPVCAQSVKSSLIPQNLRCEYLINPKGIDELSPRLSWSFRSSDTTAFGQKQTAYRITVASGPVLLNAKADQWDSGWISSSQMQQIEYKGKPLQSDKNYHWQVIVKDEKGNISPKSNAANWSTGLLKPADWTAKWIGTSQVFDPSEPDCNIIDPWLRKTFSLNTKAAKATLFLASIGYHEVYVNGKKITQDVLSPAVSDHTKRARYVAYDIAAQLKPGKNVIAVWLGTSWSIFGPYVKADRPNTPMVIAQAAIYQRAKSSVPVLTIKTDQSWKTQLSPNKLLGKWDFGHMGGELYDANQEISNWNTISCDETNWKQAIVYQPELKLSAQMVEPNRLFAAIKPVSISDRRPDGSYRVDMGVNFAGFTEVKLKGNPNDKIEFLYSERQQDDMTFNLHSAYILNKSGSGTFRNRFNYSSARWITIKGLKYKPELADIKGWMVRTNYQDAATFQCADELQNWIYDRVKWTYENLSIGGYIVDCPQRERLGYGGDAHATCETGMFNYRVSAFYSKWMEDWRDNQGTESVVGNLHDPNFARKAVQSGRILNNGIVPHSAPTYMGGGGPAWGGIVVTLPWYIYQHEGDKRILEKNFELVKGWISFLDLNTKNNLLQRYGGSWDFLGDWLWPNATAEGMNNDKPETVCLNNSYRVFNLLTAAKIARTIGRNQQADAWEKQAAIYKSAIHAKFYNAADQSYADGSMANLAAALLAEVPPANLRDEVMKRLEKEILINKKGHIHVGITGGAILFKLLRNMGRDDLIYSMTAKTDYPSWGYMKANDATTIWEMWEKDLPGHSLLHSSYLYPGAWYIDGMAGIRKDPESPGFQKFIVRPPMLTEAEMPWAKASFDAPAGLIKTAWQRKDGKISLQISVPPNCTASLRLTEKEATNLSYPAKTVKQVGSKDGYVTFELESGNHTLKTATAN
ncbi:MAG TPA: family 78 glycoside hydrolase catalytic domain [Pedobacter sp.]|nr:family 78 glycoside hydrolase catalytic domain [Pedobacter sp.]